MKAKRILLQFCLSIVLMALLSFSPVESLNSSFTISLSNAPVQGNTEYNLIVSYASGNNAYQVTPYTGFFFVGASSKDVAPGQNTVFRIKTYPYVYHIAGNVTAITCSPSCASSGSQYFGFN
jgi:hypothetical protein